MGGGYDIYNRNSIGDILPKGNLLYFGAYKMINGNLNGLPINNKRSTAAIPLSDACFVEIVFGK